ncbi:MAG: WXG100 family type VII secretion target, partial [Actinomycetales bacterium]
MAGHVLANEGALIQGANTVNNTRGDLTGQLSTIRGQIEATRGSWQGTGAVAFTQLMASWDETSARMVRVLDDFEASLRGS